MADNFSYRYGENDPITVAFKAGVAVSVGDLCYIDASDGHTLKPASSFTWNTNLATTQAAFVPVFAGVSAQRYDGSNVAIGIKDNLLRVDTAGVFDLPCAAASFNVGDFVGPDVNGGNNGLLAQQVVAVADAAHAIGRVVVAGTNLTTVRIEIYGQMNHL